MAQVPAVVSAEWVAEDRKEGCQIKLLDATWFSTKDGKQCYLDEHLSGAQHFDIFAECQLTPDNPRPLMDKIAMERQVRACGINMADHVVIYSDSDLLGFMTSGRAWWLFKYYGHEKVSIMNGGLQRWKKLGCDTTKDVPSVPAGDFIATVNGNWMAPVEALKQQDCEVQIVDTRGVATVANGTVPGSVNIPLGSILDQENATFKPLEHLKLVMYEKGVKASKRGVIYCNSGMTSCSMAALLTDAGMSVKVFLGGYTQYKKSL